MKRVVISLILIFALANQADAMGWRGHSKGGGGSSASGSTSSGSGSSGSGGDTGTSITPLNSPIGGGDTEQGSTRGNTNILFAGSPLGDSNGGNGGTLSVPEVTTMFLLGSALLGLWGFRRKIKK